MIRTHLVAQHTSAVCSIRTAAAVNAPVNAAPKTPPPSPVLTPLTPPQPLPPDDNAAVDDLQ
jgi:hypothetical protein